MSASNPQLEAAIRAAPDDVRVWSIYGDWLEAEADPRGEWVGLMLARETSPTPRLAKAERAFFEANKSWLLPPELAKKDEELVWRRGFLSAATVDTTDGLRELLAHASSRFLERVKLSPMNEELAQEWSQLMAGAPWRSVQVTNETTFEAALALPQLRDLFADLYEWPDEIAWSKAMGLETLTLERATSALLERLLNDPPPKLKELRLARFQDSAVELIASHPAAARLSLISVDGVTTEDGLEALATGKRPAKLVLCMEPDAEARLLADLPGVSSFVRAEQLETAFVVTDAPQLGSEERATLVRLAQGCRCERLVALVAPVRFGGRVFTVCRFHSDDNTASLLPVVLANELSKSKKVRAAAFTLSESNDLAKGLCFGGPAPEPVSSKRARPRVELAAAHKVEGASYRRKLVVRETLDRMLGFDPGVEALEVLLRAIDEAVPVALHGERVAQGVALPPLLTEEPPLPEEEPGEDDDDYEDEEEEEEWDDSPEFGGTEVVPVAVEEPVREEPSRIDQPVVPLFLLEPLEADDEAVEEEEEDDEDAEPDAATADAGEIWNEGPVEPEEDWAEQPLEDPLADELPDPDQVNPDHVEQSVVTYCARCANAADTLPCRSCRAELCETCLPVDETKSNELLICARCV